MPIASDTIASTSIASNPVTSSAVPSKPLEAIALSIALSIGLLLGGCQPSAPIHPRDGGSQTPAHPPASGSSPSGSATAERGEARRGASARALAGAAATIEVRLQQVQDGDSFVAITGQGERLTIRMAGIDAPERTQPWADAARRQLRAQLEGRPFMLHPVKADAYGRLVARVTRPAEPASAGSPVDVSLAQLEAGLAWYFERYERDLPPADRIRYREAADTARRARRGLWSEPSPEAPWRFRARANGPR